MNIHSLLELSMKQDSEKQIKEGKIMSDDKKLTGVEEQQNLPAGEFSSWLNSIRDAQIKESGADVPCGDCNACCRSSYFIHIRPDETQALAHIPKEILFPAPFLPKGNVLMGYGKNGNCPMLIDNKCSIYDYRPQTCRNYDCRIFPAAGIIAGDHDKALINQQIKRWKFDYPTKRDFNQHTAIQAAATFLKDRAECFPKGVVPSNSTQLAIFAIKVYDVFLKYNDESATQGYSTSDQEIAKAIMEAYEKFESKCGGH
jgi:Fe-S-cluster containining protein